MVSRRGNVSGFQSVNRRVFEQKVISVVLLDVGILFHGMETQRIRKGLQVGRIQGCHVSGGCNLTVGRQSVRSEEYGS